VSESLETREERVFRLEGQLLSVCFSMWISGAACGSGLVLVILLLKEGGYIP
jgi:hypothetical protein